jgi:hypothetical protein
VKIISATKNVKKSSTRKETDLFDTRYQIDTYLFCTSCFYGNTVVLHKILNYQISRVKYQYNKQKQKTKKRIV